MPRRSLCNLTTWPPSPPSLSTYLFHKHMPPGLSSQHFPIPTHLILIHPHFDSRDHRERGINLHHPRDSPPGSLAAENPRPHDAPLSAPSPKSDPPSGSRTPGVSLLKSPPESPSRPPPRPLMLPPRRGRLWSQSHSQMNCLSTPSLSCL